MQTKGKFPEKISRVILRYSNILLKFSIRLKDDNNNTIHNEFTYNNKVYVNITPVSYLTLELPKPTDKSFDLSRSFLIGQGNIGTVVRSMKKVLNNIYTQDIFVLQHNKVVMYEDMSKKYTEQITIPRLGQVLLIKPSVIYDENETTYEGVNIYVNNTRNIVPLSIEEYENLVYTIEKIDIFAYSQMLLNYYMIYNGNNIPDKEEKIIKNNIDWTSDKEKTTSNYRKIKDEDIFELY